MPNDLFSISYLKSFAGLVAVTYLLVQFFKEPVKRHLNDWWVRILAVVIAFVIQVFTLTVEKSLGFDSIGLALLNAFLVAITAVGAHGISKMSVPSSAAAALEEALYQVPANKPLPVETENEAGEQPAGTK